MATVEEQQQLINTLKFTPRTYKISLWGYGGEKVMGTVDEAAWDYCMEHQVDLSDIAWNSDAAEDMDLDADKLPFSPGNWYDCDGMAHANGVSKNSGTLQIEDENGNSVVEKSIEDFNGCSDDSVEFECLDEAWVGSKPKGTIVFIGSSNEKGTFFEGDIELTAPFDICKVTLQYDDVDGEELVSGVMYDGEDIDNYGGSTDGKSSDFVMVRVIDDAGNFERYEPEEKDWGHPEFGTSPSTWEKSETFKFNKQKPTIPGYYSVNWCYGSTYGSLYWDGKEFGEWEYGAFNPVNQEGVKSWSGYNWDTSSWANQPKEPPDLICSNKKCGWVGSGDDRRTDDNYDDHCPECDGTDFDWIDYDPDSKKGRANREKYCEPTLAEQAECIAGLDAALAEIAEQSGITFANDDDDNDCSCQHCTWTGSAVEVVFKGGKLYCPQCGEMFVSPKDDAEEPAGKIALPAGSWPF